MRCATQGPAGRSDWSISDSLQPSKRWRHMHDDAAKGGDVGPAVHQPTGPHCPVHTTPGVHAVA